MHDGIIRNGMYEAMVRPTASNNQRILKGIPASPGIAIGKAFVLSIESPSIATEKLSPEVIPIEVSRFRSALESITAELLNAMELAKQETASVSTIIESFLLIVGDPYISSSIIKRIEGGISAEAAVIAEYDTHKGMLDAAKDQLLRERAQDFDHVKERLLQSLRNKTLSHAAAQDSIVVSGSITPHDMLFFKHTSMLGYVTEIGGINSHASILARDMGMPAVIGIRNATSDVTASSTIIVDGYAGHVIINPNEQTLREYKLKQAKAVEYRRQLGSLVMAETATTDGHFVKLHANVDSIDHVDAAVMAGAEGVGLVRTEYLLMQRKRYPSMPEQTEWYKEIAQRAFPLPVTFRAFDVGSDKFREGIPHHEENPALGLRGIRFLLYRPDLFRQQLCAILRASALRNVKLMLPMVSVVEELDETLRILEECKEEARKDGVDFDENLPIGVMIETPSAALMSDAFAAKAAFLSIGTNDLAQYTLATDRMNEMVGDVFDAMHPSVLRLIKWVVNSGSKHNIPVSVCGELAGHAAATEVLLGLGIQELSVSPNMLLELKHRIRGMSFEHATDVTSKVMGCTTTAEVYAVLAGDTPADHIVANE